ncbi:hypothetical protein [Williamsoniiplasma lucivorax]|uniref:Uncharacterized protein n=1 Tax=Williamsoniiplasma lucivorax TaxID=209274 RepID=A0A2S5RF48_9MOLU|nr:hypothetical protein [Williamsoniiplasma lucivorax]PPE05917.1 hypothetical protein ELUCI_v1c02070 [Williamsoniiplasma lucivorax]
MKFKYNDLLISLVEEQVLLIKYNSEINQEMKVKELIKSWDSTHNIKTFQKEIEKQMVKFVKYREKLNDFELSEMDSFVWPSLLIEMGRFTDTLLNFVENSKNWVHPSGDDELTEYELSQLVLLFQLKDEYMIHVLPLMEFEVPKFMSEGLDNLQDLLGKALNNFGDFDKVIKQTKTIYQYGSDLLDVLQNTAELLTEKDVAQANQFLNWIISFKDTIYIIMLLLEKITIIDDDANGINDQIYEISDAREKQLEMLKKLAVKLEN